MVFLTYHVIFGWRRGSFQIFVILNSSVTLPYPKGEKNGHQRGPFMQVNINIGNLTTHIAIVNKGRWNKNHIICRESDWMHCILYPRNIAWRNEFDTINQIKKKCRNSHQGRYWQIYYMYTVTFYLMKYRLEKKKFITGCSFSDPLIYFHCFTQKMTFWFNRNSALFVLRTESSR